jgi:hypothetical protein
MVRTITATLAVLAATVAGGVWLLASSFRDESDTGYTVTMRPAAPLSVQACKAQIKRLHMTFANFDCSPSMDRPWFRVTVRNISDANGFPVCTTTAYARDGEALFDRAVPIGVVGGEPSGPPVQRGTTLRLVWYFDDPTGDPSYVQHAAWSPITIDRYTTTCHGRPQSQVPI